MKRTQLAEETVAITVTIVVCVVKTSKRILSLSAKEGARLTMNVEFCEDNSGTSKKMRCFRKNKVDPPLQNACASEGESIKKHRSWATLN